MFGIHSPNRQNDTGYPTETFTNLGTIVINIKSKLSINTTRSFNKICKPADIKQMQWVKIVSPETMVDVLVQARQQMAPLD